ncbi:MAG: hypothetical protein HYT39_02900 [Candidatus Sungbacteria bacterium]|nr:hypothetical protein [Candidatus Sungbacteria bacterium]
MLHQHAELSRGGWQKLSLVEQLGNIGSEVGRAAKWQGKDDENFKASFVRALDLLDLTMQDPRWSKSLKEIARVRELLCEAVFGDRKKYNTTLEDIDRYFYQFALAARLKT